MSESYGCVQPRSVAFALTMAISLAVAPCASEAATVSGRAIVIDGDTLEVAGERIRLEGIDAPELAQTCGRRWFGTWACGTRAAAALEAKTEGRRITCDINGFDRYDRALGTCFLDGRDLNAEMVREGLAWAFVKYSSRYVAEERAARTDGAGVWQGSAEPAWVFRQQKWAAAASASSAAPAGCVIKGNVSGHGQIYHMPWSPWYGKVKIEQAKGEHWFCTEAEAEAAGFRPAMQH